MKQAKRGCCQVLFIYLSLEIRLSYCIRADLQVNFSKKIAVMYNRFMVVSSGAPKGVIMSHQNIVNAMLSYTDVGPLYKNDVYMAFLPLAHVLEFISGVSCFCLFFIFC